MIGWAHDPIKGNKNIPIRHYVYSNSRAQESTMIHMEQRVEIVWINWNSITANTEVLEDMSSKAATGIIDKNITPNNVLL